MQEFEYAIDPQVTLDAMSDMRTIRVILRDIRKQERQWINVVRNMEPNYNSSEEFSSRCRLWSVKGEVNWHKGLRLILESLLHKFRQILQGIREAEDTVSNGIFEQDGEPEETYSSLFFYEEDLKRHRAQLKVLALLAGHVVAGPEKAGES